MKKNLLVLLAIFLIAITAIMYLFYQYQEKVRNATAVNKEYEAYEDKIILGIDVASIINRTIDINERNKIEKDGKGNYIENGENSIKLYVKFLESDDVFLMESINRKGIDTFLKNFGAFEFKCTKIEYHDSTKGIKSILFEEVQF